MQHFCNHGYIFERCFSSIVLQERIVVMIWFVRDDITDQFSFYLVFSLKNEGFIAVFLKITFMTSRDRKCVGGARKWRHAVCILLAIILVFT